MRRIPVLIPTTLAALLAACGYDSTSPAGDNLPGQPSGNPVQAATVDVRNNQFVPNSVNLVSGGTVTWSWSGNDHDVAPVGSPTFSPAASVQNAGFTLGPVTFNQAGTFRYRCTVHSTIDTYGGLSGMTGVIFVQQ
jgi:plastocyanin